MTQTPLTTGTVRNVSKRNASYAKVIEHLNCLCCGGEIVWNPIREDHCDNCLAPAGATK